MCIAIVSVARINTMNIMVASVIVHIALIVVATLVSLIKVVDLHSLNKNFF